MPDKRLCVFTGKQQNCGNCDGHREDRTGKGTHTIHMGHSVSGPILRN